MVWNTNKQLEKYHAVPDSCCLKREPGCGVDIFVKHDLEKMAEYVKRIHVHGCLRAMTNVLQVREIRAIFAMKKKSDK